MRKKKEKPFDSSTLAPAYEQPKEESDQADSAGELTVDDIVAMEEKGDAEALKEIEPPGLQEKTSLIPAPETSVARIDPLQRYMAEIRRYSLLDPEEEHRLAVTYKEKGDIQAAHKLVTSNLRLVVKIAMDYHRYWMNLLDLVQEGNVGLMQAVRHYDPYRGVKLSSYSSFWIKAYMLKFIIDNWSLVKIGTTQDQRKLFFNLKKEKEKFALLGYDPSPENLAEGLHVKPGLVVEMTQRMAAGDVSLDQPVSADSESRRIDFLASREENVDDQLAEAEVRQLFSRKLREFRERLSDKELYIFDQRLLSENPETLNVIGDHYSISRERIRQIEERLIEKLRRFFKEEVPELADFTVGKTAGPS